MLHDTEICKDTKIQDGKHKHKKTQANRTAQACTKKTNSREPYPTQNRKQTTTLSMEISKAVKNWPRWGFRYVSLPVAPGQIKLITNYLLLPSVTLWLMGKSSLAIKELAGSLFRGWGVLSWDDVTAGAGKVQPGQKRCWHFHVVPWFPSGLMA